VTDAAGGLAPSVLSRKRPEEDSMAVSRRDFLSRRALEDLQAERLRLLLAEVSRNPFYADRLARAGVSLADVRSPADLRRLPFTTKAELLADQHAHPPYGTNLTYSLERYCRLHQTSGTSGQPLRWLDTPESWGWALDCWDQVFDAAGVRRGDRLFFGFSFGPFLGFWTAYESASRRGYWCLPGGGMSSGARLRFLLDHGATVVLCTPTYALHLAEVAAREGLDLAGSPVRALIVAGEPGGSIPATRARIEAGWGARLFDHSGMTEVGPTTVECAENPAGYIPEIIDPETLEPVPPGRTGELVLTNLGRWGSPLLRYRTGDLVCADERPCPCGRAFVRLKGGILGRADDMIHLRGNNLHPSTLEAVIRRFAEVAEYRVEVDRSAALAVLRVEVEPAAGARGEDVAERVDRAIRDELLFRAEVRAVAPGSLPRYEMKARRVVLTG
jgi:phenylacetate-CoA ligase